MTEFFLDALNALGAILVAGGVSELVRSYFPNYHRVLTPILMIVAVDAAFSQFTTITWGFQTGLAACVGLGLWWLRRGRVVRQDGSIDNG